MNQRPEGLPGIFLLCMEKRSTRKTYHHYIFAHDGFHSFMQITALRSMTLVDEDEDVSLCLKSLGKLCYNLLQILFQGYL